MRCFSVLLLLPLLLFLTGCQKQNRPDNMPELIPLRVTFLQAGQPLTEASIRLIPDDATSPWSSGGSTGSDGMAVILTHGEFVGVPAGAYKVTVSKIEMPAAATGQSSLENLNAPLNADGSTYDLVAPEYSIPNQTPLHLEASPGASDQKFDLGPAVRIKKSGPPS